jgi:hypothetical protein
MADFGSIDVEPSDSAATEIILIIMIVTTTTWRRSTDLRLKYCVSVHFAVI